ncbi:hypothetical protein HU747_22410, partial [Pseudomonas taiwanensis]|nr:hypothetical protein [Pseudomonas taiwanensis]
GGLGSSSPGWGFRSGGLGGSSLGWSFRSSWLGGSSLGWSFRSGGLGGSSPGWGFRSSRFGRRFGSGWFSGSLRRRLGNRRLGFSFHCTLVERLAHGFTNLANTLGQFQAFLSIALELLDISTCLRLTVFERIEQLFKFANGFVRFALGLGFACLGRVLQLQATVMQFFLGLYALFFQLGQQFLSIRQRLGAGVFQMFEQAARKLLEQVQRRTDWLLLSRHGLPPG